MARKTLLLLLGALILAPIPYNAALGKPPWMPVPLNEFWRFTDLFSHRVTVWPSYHVLIESADGAWRELPRELVYRGSLFGGMTRLDMTLLNFSPRRTDSPETEAKKRLVLDHVCQEFLSAYAKAQERSDPGGEHILPVAVRLVIGWLPIVNGIPSERWSARLQQGQRFDVVYEYRSSGA